MRVYAFVCSVDFTLFLFLRSSNILYIGCVNLFFLNYGYWISAIFADELIWNEGTFAPLLRGGGGCERRGDQ